ncbi:helix-turn-helix domain-containing protein [Pseudidiomarina homiensis]|uniref:Transcriptional regulator n=1 Tax=Pseudidiomarina homiensis TaxID=364198 RepID=A0A432XY07_9GAMM|nr:helix-turn-helix transcriptional regulator [Pseudidiomarina homiensis]RUO53514.1 transcriptional regulator [Pseudidiomarina homiensis]
MVKKLKEFEAEMSPDVLSKANAQAKQIIAEIKLKELRKQQGVSQAELASALGVAQANISQIEGRGDARISTLSSYVRALGGELELHARFPDGQLVRLNFDQ